MTKRRERAMHIKTHASKRLRTNLLILSVVYVVLLLITLYELIISQALFIQVLLALIIGFVAGIISSRMYKISWDKDEAKVVGRIDIYGAVVLILFIIFELSRDHIAAVLSHGDTIASVSLVLLTSALYGRVVGTAKKILHILSEEKIIG